MNIPTKIDADIHLISGLLARGTITAVSQDVVVLENRPALHSQHGTLAFEKIMLSREHIVAIGYKEGAQK